MDNSKDITEESEEFEYECGECGATVSKDDKICPKCYADIRKVEEEELTPEEQKTPANIEKPVDYIEYADFQKRFLAHLIDRIIVPIIIFICLVISAISEYIPGDIDNIIFIAFSLIGAPWLYYSITESSSKQGTIGKMIVGIKVTDMIGKRITFRRATARFFSKLISEFSIIGYFVFFFTKKKQTLHDLIAGTIVVKKVDEM